MAIKNKKTATIFIPTFNAGEYLKDLLDQVFKQINVSFEVFIIDSGSSDHTLKIIEKYPRIRLYKIPNSEFGHGKTRNLAAQMSDSEFIVYLSQDAVPCHERWLEYMLEPFKINADLYCVFGKQIPRPFADAPTKREVNMVFDTLGPDHSIMINRKYSLFSNEIVDKYLTFFSDVNSAVRRDYIINKIPYRDVKYSEDQMLGSDVLDRKYLKAYSPLGTVWHSNEYKLGDYFKRKYDEYIGMFDALGVLPNFGKKTLLKLPLVWTVYDIVFILKDKDYTLIQKIKNILESPIRNYSRVYAGYIVTNKSKREKTRNKYSLENKLKNKL